MATLINIPNKAHSTQNITLGGLSYDITLTYNGRDKRWSMSLSRNSVEIISGIRIVENQLLLYRYSLEGFSHGDFLVNRAKVDNKDVGRDNFGINEPYYLLYLTNEELGQLQ